VNVAIGFLSFFAYFKEKDVKAMKKLILVLPLFLVLAPLYSQNDPPRYNPVCHSSALPTTQRDLDTDFFIADEAQLVTKAVSLNQTTRIDKARLKNNVYREEVRAQISQTNFTSNKLLNSADSPQNTYDKYIAMDALNPNKHALMLDAFSYLKGRDVTMADKVVSHYVENNSKNIQALRIASSAFSATENFEKVLLVNEKIIELDPSDMNGHLNKALAKRELGKYQEALDELMVIYRGNEYFSATDMGFSKTIKREVNNLIAKNKSSLNLNRVDAEYLNNVKYKARLVFEWNIPGAEFEIQFVNPQKRFFNWEHTNKALKSRLKEEVANNCRLEEYEFYGDVMGEWVVNAKYLGERIDNEVPLVLKAMIYKNFGSDLQTKEEVMVHFSKPDEKINVKRLLIQ